LSPGSTSARLLISCADRPGIVAAVAGFLRDAGANIVHSDQHSTDPEGGRFFMRMEFVLPLAEGERGAFERAFARDVGDPLGLDWRVWYVADRKRMGILVSRTDHCLLDLLWRWRRGEFEADVVAVASNHPDLRADVDAFALPYHHVPVTATAAMQLVEQGKLDLDSPATRWVPDLAGTRVLEGWDDDGNPRLRAPKASVSLSRPWIKPCRPRRRPT